MQPLHSLFCAVDPLGTVSIETGTWHLQIQELSSDDYFQRNPEFSTWLREERRQFFNELSAEDSRALFGEAILLAVASSRCPSMPSAVLPCYGSSRQGAQVSVRSQHMHGREAGAGCSQA